MIVLIICLPPGCPAQHAWCASVIIPGYSQQDYITALKVVIMKLYNRSAIVRDHAFEC